MSKPDLLPSGSGLFIHVRIGGFTPLVLSLEEAEATAAELVSAARDCRANLIQKEHEEMARQNIGAAAKNVVVTMRITENEEAWLKAKYGSKGIGLRVILEAERHRASLGTTPSSCSTVEGLTGE